MARLRGKTGLYDKGIHASASAPGNGYVGQLWFNNSTGVLYQRMHDGTSNFWLDISSGGIGTSISEGVDVVGDIDPHKSINPSGGVGSVYFNREKNRHFVCTDASSDANVWAGRFTGNGGDNLIHIAPNGTVTTGTSANAKTSGYLIWKVPHFGSNQASTYYYQCTAHPGSMYGLIKIRTITY